MKKRGISSVVATVLLVLLTVTVMAVISAFVIPYVKNALEGSVECNDYNEYFSFNDEFGYNCYNAENEEYVLSIEAKTSSVEVSDKVAGFVLQVVKSGEASVIGVKEGVGVSGLKMGSGGDLTIPKSGEIRTYNYTEENVDSFSVAVELKSGKICEKSDSIKIRSLC